MKTRVCAVLLAAIVCFSTHSLSAETKSTGKALYEAALFQDIPKMEELLKKGADVNYMENGRPILGWAAQSGNVKVVEMLLAAGANPNIFDTGVRHTPLMRAIDTQFTEIVRALLMAKADPNAKNKDGESCLMMAVSSRKPEIVSALIDAGADVSFVTSDGNSPALSAAQEGSDESRQILVLLGAAKAEMNASNAAYTPLIYATEQGNKDLVELLLSVGADPNRKSNADQYPIFRALDNAELLKVLLDGRADPNQVSASGDLPLIEAIRNSYVESAKVLIENGADLQKKDSAGNAPLQFAEESHQDELAQLLRTKAEPVQVADKTEGGYKVYAAEGKNGECGIVEAARMQMEIHGLLQKEVDAGRMSSEIFRTFMNDTEEYGKLLTSDPPAACRLLEKLRKKYGV